MTCKHCDYCWKPRVKEPKECPNCKRHLVLRNYYEIVSDSTKKVLFTFASRDRASAVSKELLAKGIKTSISRRST